DIDIGLAGDLHRIADQGNARQVFVTLAMRIARRRVRDHDRTADALSDFVGVLTQNTNDALANRAKTQKTYSNRTAHACSAFASGGGGAGVPFCSNRLIPRTAWLLRCSFSISAKRT